MSRRLESKVTIVVGAARGIGAATARRLCEEGATVILADLSVEAGQALASELARDVGAAEFRFADLRDAASLTSLMDSVAKEHGRIDGLFNNAVDSSLMDRDLDLLSTDPAIIDQAYQTDLRGYVLSCRAALPHMLRQGGGAIVQSSSVAASRGLPAPIGYACAKAGVDALTRHIALRWGKQNVRCNSIQPGLVMTEAAMAVADALPFEPILAHTPSPRLGEVNDIAGLVAFLLSEEAKWINGQVLCVDGGLTSGLYEAPVR